MNIGDKIYYVNSGLSIDKYEIINIDNEFIYMRALLLHDLYINISLNDFNKSPNFSLDYDKALERKIELQKIFEQEQQEYFDKILEETLNAVTLDQVEKHGVLLRKLETDKDDGHYKAFLYDYNKQKYIIVYRYTQKNKNGKYKNKECVKFTKK